MASDKPRSAEVLERRLRREKAKVAHLEQVIEDRSREIFQANETLEKANAFMAEILGSMAGALIVTDEDGVVELTNARFSALLDYGPEAPIGQPLEQFVVGGMKHIKTLVNSRVENQASCVTQNGTEIPVTLSVGRLQQSDGKGGYIVVLNDARERVRSQQALAELNEQLVVASREAGMAEVAIDVLHNVGNVLNSVNIAANVLEELATQNKTNSLQRLLGLLHEHEGQLGHFFEHDPRAQKIPMFLSKIVESFDAYQKQLADEATQLVANVDHIKTAVSAQQIYAKRGGSIEHVDVQKTLNGAIDVYRARYERAGITIIQDYRGAEHIETDRHKFMQIAINMVSNALDAIRMNSDSAKEFRIITRDVDESLEIVFEDTGVGIEPEYLERIFAHGFTTKKTGHGFGLHSAANSATEMGGRLVVESEGENKGARFILSLPHVVDVQQEQAS